MGLVKIKTDEAAYHAGDIVKGTIILDLKPEFIQSSPEILGLYLHVEGREKVDFKPTMVTKTGGKARQIKDR